MSGEEPKIIVDDDWKAQVEKEKAIAAGKLAEPTSADEPTEALAASPTAENQSPMDTLASAADDASLDAPPPASLETLVSMLFTQALAALGQIPGPDGQVGQVNKPFAKYFIDTLDMLSDKTKGNLSSDESKMISDTLHAMRMAFVSVRAK